MSTFDDDHRPGPSGPDDTRGLEARLRAFGHLPIDPATRSSHLTGLASVRPARSGLRDKVKVAAALAGGFLLGSTGLAFAGALPAPAQDAASEAMARVGIEVPVGTERYFGEECVAAGDGSHARNRGQYLKQERAKGADAFAAAKASDCGRPVVSLTGDDGDTDAGPDVEAVPQSEGTPPEKCADGTKVTGRSQGKGRSDAAAKSERPCETPEPRQSEAGVDAADDGALDTRPSSRGSAPDGAGPPEGVGRPASPADDGAPPAGVPADDPAASPGGDGEDDADDGED